MPRAIKKRALLADMNAEQARLRRGDAGTDAFDFEAFSQSLETAARQQPNTKKQKLVPKAAPAGAAAPKAPVTPRAQRSVTPTEPPMLPKKRRRLLNREGTPSPTADAGAPPQDNGDARAGDVVGADIKPIELFPPRAKKFGGRGQALGGNAGKRAKPPVEETKSKTEKPAEVVAATDGGVDNEQASLDVWEAARGDRQRAMQRRHAMHGRVLRAWEKRVETQGLPTSRAGAAADKSALAAAAAAVPTSEGTTSPKGKFVLDIGGTPPPGARGTRTPVSADIDADPAPLNLPQIDFKPLRLRGRAVAAVPATSHEKALPSADAENTPVAPNAPVLAPVPADALVLQELTAVPAPKAASIAAWISETESPASQHAAAPAHITSPRSVEEPTATEAVADGIVACGRCRRRVREVDMADHKAVCDSAQASAPATGAADKKPDDAAARVVRGVSTAHSGIDCDTVMHKASSCEPDVLPARPDAPARVGALDDDSDAPEPLDAATTERLAHIEAVYRVNCPDKDITPILARFREFPHLVPQGLRSVVEKYGVAPGVAALKEVDNTHRLYAYVYDRAVGWDEGEVHAHLAEWEGRHEQMFFQFENIHGTQITPIDEFEVENEDAVWGGLWDLLFEHHPDGLHSLGRLIASAGPHRQQLSRALHERYTPTDADVMPSADVVAERRTRLEAFLARRHPTAAGSVRAEELVEQHVADFEMWFYKLHLRAERQEA